MTPDHYHTIFDVTKVGFKSWSFSAFGLIFIVVGLALPALLKSGFPRRTAAPLGKWFPRIFLGFAIFWTSTSFVGTFSDYRRSVDAMKNGQTEFVEGMVTNFHPMPAAGHAMESFMVKGVRFRYSDYVITAGFNNTASHGGPIREGLLVRIWHRDGEILRLDINTQMANQTVEPNPHAKRISK